MIKTTGAMPPKTIPAFIPNPFPGKQGAPASGGIKKVPPGFKAPVIDGKVAV